MKAALLRSLSFFTFLLLLFPSAGFGQVLYNESISGDLPNTCCGTVYSVSLPGTYTFSGTLATPTDGQDWFQIGIPVGLQISSITYSIAGGSISGGINFGGFASVNAPGAGVMPVAPFSYPLPSGDYFTQLFANFSTGTSWTMSFVVDAPLAIDIKAFYAENTPAGNRLKWTTGAEHAGDRFELQRSDNGRSFLAIAQMDAQGAASDYSYTDVSPVKGMNYYRLRMMMNSGENRYSNIISIEAEAGTGFFQAFLNQASGMLNLTLNGSLRGHARLEVLDVNGNTLRTVEVLQNAFSLDLSRLQPGMYFVVYQDDSRRQTVKIIKG